MNKLSYFINEKLKLNNQSKLKNGGDISKLNFYFYFTLDDYSEKEYYKEQFYNAFKKWPQKDLDSIHNSIQIVYHEKYDGVTVAYLIQVKIGSGTYSIAFHESTDYHYEVTNKHNISKIDWLDSHNNLIECFVDQIHKDNW